MTKNLTILFAKSRNIEKINVQIIRIKLNKARVA